MDEKKYKDALERARQEYNTTNSIERKQWLEELFPELNELEDDRIRKELLEHCKNQAKPYIQTGNKCPQIQSWITWLENKGKESSWKPSKEEMNVLYSLAYITNQYDEHKEEVITRLYQDLKREFFNGSSYENMFPNTEDDVRRRSIIQVLEYARSLDSYNQYGKADIDKNIAWLEKQAKKEEDVRYKYLEEILTADDIYQMSMNEVMLANAKKKAIDALSKIQVFKLLNIAEKPYTFKSIPRLLEMVVPCERAKHYCQKLIDTLKEEGYVVDAKIITSCLNEMNGENIAMAVQDNNSILNSEDCNRIKSIEYLLHELDNHNFDDWFNSVKNKFTPERKFKLNDDKC